MADNMWRIRDVKEDVRKYVRIYALQNNLTTAQALEDIVQHADAYLKLTKKKRKVR